MYLFYWGLNTMRPPFDNSYSYIFVFDKIFNVTSSKISRKNFLTNSKALSRRKLKTSHVEFSQFRSG